MSVRTLRPVLRPLKATSTPLQRTQQTRQFFNPFASPAPATLTASRTLPYPTLPLYNLIADIQSYPTFLPYCRSATVTSWTPEDTTHKRAWPQSATLTIGFAEGVQESFESKVVCVPPSWNKDAKGRNGVGIVEAVSGEAEVSELPGAVAGGEAKKLGGGSGAGAGEASPLTYLKTRWTVTHFPFKPAPGTEQEKEVHERTDVQLSIEYKFANPVYEAMSRAVAGKVADKMIEAFEARARSLLGDQAGRKA